MASHTDDELTARLSQLSPLRPGTREESPCAGEPFRILFEVHRRALPDTTPTTRAMPFAAGRPNDVTRPTPAGKLHRIPLRKTD